MSPFHLAMERGYFKANNIDVEFIPLVRSNDAIPVLAKGNLEAAIYAITPPLINAIAKGARIRIVAARDQALPDCGDTGSIYARSAIKTVAGLRGKRIANGYPAGIVEFALDSALEKAGLDPSSVRIVQLRPPEAAAAMLRGEIDAMIGPDLSSMKALQSPEVTCLTTFGQTRPGFQFGFIYFGRNLLDAPVAVGAGFLRAYFRGVREFAGGVTPEFMLNFAANAGRDPKVVAALCRRHVIEGGRINRESVDTFAKWALRKGYCEQPIPPDSLIDEQFLEAAQ